MMARILRRTTLAPAAALALTLTPLASFAPSATAAPASAAWIGHHSYRTVQAALDAAESGDVVRLPRGVVHGGLRIATSLTLVGAGAGRTVIVGGGHVLTVGTPSAAPGTQPSVTIRGVTITGGLATDSPDTGNPVAPGAAYEAAGGGIAVASDTAGVGGSLTVVDSVVAGNRTAPARQDVRGPVPADPTEDDIHAWPICPDHEYCNYAGSYGGGIYTRGPLTLVRTAVVGNVAGGRLASDADGGGVYLGDDAPLTVVRSHIDRNRAIAVAPYGRYAEGAGVFTGQGTDLRLVGSTVDRNVASLRASFPVSYDDYPAELGTVATDTLVNGGGLHVGDQAGAIEIHGSHVDRNVASYDDPDGAGSVINSGLQTNISTGLTMTDSTVSGNLASVRARTTEAWGAQGGAVLWDSDAAITRSAFVGNRTQVVATGGQAWAGAAVQAAQYFDEGPDGSATTIADSVIAGNTVSVRSSTGAGVIAGVGLLSDTAMTLVRTRVTGNAGVALTPRSSADTTLLGGGIDDGADHIVDGYTGALSTLALRSSLVSGNSLRTTTRDASVAGGGIHAPNGATLLRSLVTHNSPDDCDAC